MVAGWSSILYAGCEFENATPLKTFPILHFPISLCLKKLNVFKPEDYTALAIKLFRRYIQVMRSLQSTYWLEPAGKRLLTFFAETYYIDLCGIGSHGAYGLDDYHFLPFGRSVHLSKTSAPLTRVTLSTVFGSAQLRTHKHIRPKAIHDKDVVDEFAKDYMYLACIQFVESVSRLPLVTNVTIG
jgi:serine/threonine-protein phosphatase 2A activator